MSINKTISGKHSLVVILAPIKPQNKAELTTEIISQIPHHITS
jgi:hypothetical protein